MYNKCIVLFLIIVLSRTRANVTEQVRIYDRLPDYETNMNEYRGYPLNFTEIEELFLYKETKEFLDRFEDQEHRELIKQQLYYCPYTSLCQFSFNLYLPRRPYFSICLGCSCAPDCGTPETHAHNCCPDILNYTEWKILLQKQSPSSEYCIWNYIKPGNGRIRHGYRMVYKCNGTDMDSQRYCDSNHNMSRNILPNVTPVTDTVTNTSYINEECALCNNVESESLTLWQTGIVCEDFNNTPAVKHYFYIHDNAIDYIVSERHCNIEFSPARLNAEPCPTGNISNCNLTGQWKMFDPFIQRACLFFNTGYRTMYLGGFVYRNVFCALCNGLIPADVTMFYFGGWLPGITYSFTGLLKFEDMHHSNRPPAEHLDGHVFDPVKKKYLKLHCSSRRTLKDDKCEMNEPVDRDTIYTDTMRIIPLEDLPTDGSLISSIMENFLQWYRGMMGLVSQTKPYPTSYSLEICNERFHIHLRQGCFPKSPRCKTSGLIRSLIFDIKTQIKGWHHFQSIEKIVSNIKSKTFKMIHYIDTFRYEVLSFQIQEIDFDLALTENINLWPPDFGSNEITTEHCGFDETKFKVVKFLHQKPCPIVSLDVQDYKWLVQGFDLVIPVLGMRLNGSEFFFTENITHAHVCSESLLRSRNPYNPSQSLKLEPLLYFVCFSISLVALLFSLTIFIILPKLRTVSGINNMILISCLASAQILFLASSYGKLEPGTTSCKTFGILTHFVWLVFVFWMGVCTFHGFKAFVPASRSVTDNQNQTLITYICLTSLLALVFVLVNILVSLFGSDFNDIGYGKSICYITSDTLFGFTFVMPVGLTVLTNVTVFFIAIWKMKTVSDLKKSTETEQRDVLILTKLSALAGLAWISYLVYRMSGLALFLQIFIIFNSSQGVFLSLSFVCKRSVFRMLKDRKCQVFSKHSTLQLSSLAIRTATESASLY